MKRNRLSSVAILATASVMTVSMLAPVWGQGNGRGRNHGLSPHREAAGATIVFTTQEREIISDWFWDNRNGLPPGLARRESLPAGLQKQLRRNGTLPPGLQKKLIPLPYGLESRLVRLPGEFIRVMIGRDIILLDRRNNGILDVISNVIRDPGERQREHEARERGDEPVFAARNPEPAPAPTPASVAGATTRRFSLKVRTTAAMSTESTKPGDKFIGTLEEPVYAGARMLARKGAQVEGQVVDSDRGGRVKGVASLTVKIVRFRTTSGQYAAVNSEPLVVEANATKGEDATKIALTTGIGAGVGALIGGGKGAAVGAATGAATGTGVVLATRGDAAVIPSESVLEFAVTPAE